MKPRIVTLFVILLAVLTPLTSAAQHTSDKEGIKMAVLDYVDGIYLVQPERIERSVSKNLAKVGYWRAKDATEYKESPMTYDQLYSVAETWNKEGQVDPKTARKDIEILDMMDKTAVVKLSAHWGMDYLNLAKVDERWMIINVLWQSYPPEN